MVTNYIRDTASFDSHLYMGDMNRTTNADLQLILRVFIKPGPTGADVVQSMDQNGHTYKHNAVAWDPATRELEKFREKFKKVAEDAWTNKFWLVPPAAYLDLDYPYINDPVPKGGKRVQCNLRCRLVVQLLADANDAHRVVEAVKYVPKAGSAAPRENANLYFQDSLAPQGMVDTAGKGHTQNVVVHEVGHALGLPHIGVTLGTRLTPGGAVCTVATQNTPICYEGPKKSDVDDIMGLGSNFSLSDGSPWLDRVPKHTGIAKADWKLTMTRPAPKPRP